LCFEVLGQSVEIRTAKGQEQDPDPRIAIPITGIVLDDATGQPFVKEEGKMLPMVRILENNVRVWVNSKGEFSFKGVFTSVGTLRVSYTGYSFQDVKFDLKNRGPFTIRLRLPVDTNQTIEEVTVVETGYFRVPQERATGSFVHIDQELLNRTVGSSILDRLEGVTRGLIFNQSSMGATTIHNASPMSIRGISSIHATKSPLIILDNFPFPGDINSINPEDIESVTVLQDAAAASIWGARAGNGVIVLTSKSGKYEQPLKVSLRTDVSVSEKPDLYYNPSIPIAEYIDIERYLYEQGAWNGRINQIYPYITPTVEALLAHRNGHISESEMDARIAQLKTRDVRHDLDQYVYRPTGLYKAALNFRGGSKQHNYYLSAGYDKNLGNIDGHHNERLTLQARNSYRMFGDKLTFDTHIQFASDRNSRGGNVHYQVLYDRFADEYGNPISIGGGYSSAGLRQSYIDTAGNGLLQDWAFYPVENVRQHENSVTQTIYQVRPTVTYRPVDWLGITANYQYVKSFTETENLKHEDSFDMRDIYNRFTQINHLEGVAVSSIPRGGQLNQSNDGFAAHYFRSHIAADKTLWEKHQLNVLGGIEINNRETLSRAMPVMLGYKSETETYTPFDLNQRYRQYLTGGLGNVLVVPTDMDRSTTLNRNILYFSNASYTYDRRYTATFSARKDAANIFGVEVNQRGRPFWSAGLRWQLHEEDFYKVDWVSKLVLRATHGYTGNVSGRSAHITSAISTKVDTDTRRIYQTITNPPNPQLSWETVGMTNLALDFSAFGKRMFGSVEHYRKKATDLLSSQPINPSSGVTSLYGNWSSLKGWGWDVNLTGKNIQTKSFLWQSDLILSYTNEEVTHYELKPSSDRLYLTSNLGQYPIEGKPLYGIYSFAWAGLDETGQPQGYMDGEVSKDYTNIYNNTRLDDYVYHGRATPSLFGSIRNTFRYKELELSFNISAQFGYYIRREGMNYASLYSVTGYTSAPFQYDYMDRWQQPGDEARTHVPVAQYPVVANRETFYGMTEVLVEKGDHIRLRDIRVAYRLKLPQIGLPSVQVYGYANNLGVLWATNRLGFDPEAVYRTAMSYPNPRNYSFGLNIDF
jgi:TonB-linked SusC/RagA family outer membrane protein